MKLVVGLGNPGSEYRDTRHNVGFRVIDFLCARHCISLDCRRHQAIWGRGRIGRCPVVLAQPLTFMNLSGRAVKTLLENLKGSPEDLLVVHDDIDLALGKIKLKYRGGDAGHGGIRSIVEDIGINSFLRVRTGVGRPIKGSDVIDYVLSPFHPEELLEASKSIERAAVLVEDLLDKSVNDSWWEEDNP